MLRRQREGHTLVLTVDRPEARNALSSEVARALVAACDEAARDERVRAVVLTGAGSTFVSGGDLRELRAATTRQDAEALSDWGMRLCRALEDLPMPVLAAVNGHAVGGGAELACACDVRIGSRSTTFSFRQTQMGVTTAWGTAQRLPAIVGAGHAARMLLFGRTVTAEEAIDMGLLDDVAEPPSTPLETALARASELARSSPGAVARMKAVLVAARRGSDELRAVERAEFVEAWLSPDHAEAVEAYFAKRAPVWSPRPTRG